LNEDGFTELVVADSMSSSETMKSSLQTFFTKKASSSSLHYSDLCTSLMRQMDAHRVAAKFLLKQFLTATSSHGHERAKVANHVEDLKQETTRLRQENSNMKLQYEKAISALQTRLQARDAANSELQKKVNALQQANDKLKRGLPSSRVPLADPSRGEGRRRDQGFKNITNKQSTEGQKAWSSKTESQHPQTFRPVSLDRSRPRITPIQYSGRPLSTNSDLISERHRNGDFDRSSYNFSTKPSFRVNKRRRDDTPSSSLYRSTSPFSRGNSVQSFIR